nr:MAG TPA: hypothetical protein [Caudoviricetes sp.]
MTLSLWEVGQAAPLVITQQVILRVVLQAGEEGLPDAQK